MEVNLEQILRAHAAWLRDVAEGERANLSGDDLCGAHLHGTDLRWAYLDEADLSGADLSGADLRWAHLDEADLSGADLSNADLRGVNLSEATLCGADLRWANLRGADLSSANLSGADLSGADLSEAKLSNTILSEVDLRGADLRNANLSEAILSGVDLRGARFPDAPAVLRLDSAILAALDAGGRLDMSIWHCGTAHCRSGWTVTLAGEAGRQLEEEVGTCAAAALIYAASRPDKRVPDFFASDADALADLRRCAGEED